MKNNWRCLIPIPLVWITILARKEDWLVQGVTKIFRYYHMKSYNIRRRNMILRFKRKTWITLHVENSSGKFSLKWISSNGPSMVRNTREKSKGFLKTRSLNAKLTTEKKSFYSMTEIEQLLSNMICRCLLPCYPWTQVLKITNPFHLLFALSFKKKQSCNVCLNTK